MTKTVFAHTPFVADFPPFVNLSRKEDGSYALTVRSHGNGGRDLGTIQLSAKTVEALAYGALADLCQESADPVVNGPFASQVTLHVVDPGPDSLEQEIQAKADKGPRVTPAALKNEIVSEWYFTGSDGAYGASLRGVPAEQQPPVPIGHPLTLMTFCVLVLRNGFTVHGASACASPENFNADIGRRVARENAEREIWPLLGFLLREELSRPMPPENGLISELAAT